MAKSMKDSPSSPHTHQSNKPTKKSSKIIMDKLKTSIIERLKKLNPNKTLSPSQINSIQLQLQHAFPSFHIPTHPTYSIMIEKAIEVLNEEDGSSEEAISEYILANYEDLPWAHNRFLSYYLHKLCKDGEVVCISSNHYSVPWLMDEFSKKKSLMMVHPMEDDNLDGNAKNVDVGSFQEDGEEADVLVKFRVKRKRNSSVVQDDEEEEVGGTEIVEAHDNVVENSEVPVNDDENVSNDEHQIVAVDEVQSVVALEQGSQSAPSANLGDEAKAEGSSLAYDPCEGKSEPMVSTMDKALPGEHEEELRREPLVSDHAITGATLMLVPSVSIEKLTNDKDISDKLVLERKDQDSCAADLKIVAVEKGYSNSAENREIVLGLSVPQPEELRRMVRPRKKSKHCQVGKSTTSATPTTASPDFSKGTKMRYVYRSKKKSNQFDNEGLHDGFSTMAPDMKLDPKLSESSMSETPLQSQQGHKASVFGSNLMISSPSRHRSELMYMEDEDLNLPLQVLKMHGKWRKSSVHAKLSKLGASSENPVKKMSLKGKKTTHRKRKQKVLQCDGKKSYSSEAVAAPERETFQPVQSPGGSSNDCEGHDGNSTAATTSEKHAVEPLHEMQVQVTLDTFVFDDQHHKSGENEQIKGDHGVFHKSGQYDGINPRESPQAEDLKQPTEDNQQQERSSEPATNLVLEEAASMVSPVFQEIMEEENDGRIANSPVESPSVKSSSPSHLDLEYNDMNPRDSSKVENENAPKDLEHPIEHHQQQERPSEPEEEAVPMVLPVSQWKVPEEENDGGIAIPLQESPSVKSSSQESPSVKSSSPSHLDLEEGPLKQNESDVPLQDLLPDLAISIKGIMSCSNQWTLQEKKEVKKIKHRGRPPKNENGNQDGEESVYSHSLKQEGISETVSYQQSNPRNKQRKKDGRGRPRKIKGTIIENIPTPLDLYDMLQKELAQAVVCQSENKDGENSSSQTEPVTQDGVPLPANHFLEKKDEQGVPSEEPESTRNDVTVLVNLHPQQKQVPSETTNFQPGGQGRRRKQEVVQCEPTTAIDEVTVISMHDQQQAGLSEQVASESRKKELTTEDMVAALNFQEQQHEKTCEPSTYQRKMNGGKPTKQIGATNKDVATDLDLQDQQQEGSSVQATHQMKKDGRGRLPKSEVAEKSPLDLDQQQELPYKPVVHPSPEAFNVSRLSAHKLRAALEEPVSLRTRSKKGGARKPQAAETLLGSEADHQRKELVPILLDEEFDQQEVVPKTDQEKKQWQSSSENTEESEAEVHKSPSRSEQVTNCSHDESLLVDQPCKLEGQGQDSIGKQGQQLRSLTTVVKQKQKSCDHIPPSAIRRSQRINQRS